MYFLNLKKGQLLELKKPKTARRKKKSQKRPKLASFFLGKKNLKRWKRPLEEPLEDLYLIPPTAGLKNIVPAPYGHSYTGFTRRNTATQY